MSTDENKLQRGEWFEGQFYPDDGDEEELPAPSRQAIPEADLQLLEQAARAIGAVRVEVVEGENWLNLHFEDGSTVFGWNPLRHSDDALALAVRLGILEQAGAELGMSYNQVGDELANARHAIVHLAAEIGKATL